MGEKKKPEPTEKTLVDIEKFYESELKRRDEIILELQKEKELLLRTALLQSRKVEEWKRTAKEILKKVPQGKK